jgi:hypothetical protein
LQRARENPLDFHSDVIFKRPGLEREHSDVPVARDARAKIGERGSSYFNEQPAVHAACERFDARLGEQLVYRRDSA